MSQISQTISTFTRIYGTSGLHNGPSVSAPDMDVCPESICQSPQSKHQRLQSDKLQPRKIIRGLLPI